MSNVNTTTRAKLLKHFAQQAEDVWEQFAKLMDEGYFSTDTVNRMFGEEAKRILFDGNARAVVTMQWDDQNSAMDPEEFTPEFLQEEMGRRDSTHVCQTSSKGRYYGDWATVESIETGTREPTPEEVFGEGSKDALLFKLAEEAMGREKILETIPDWQRHFGEKTVSTITLMIERPNTTSKNDVASYFRAFIRDYISGIHPSSTQCVELEPVVPDDVQEILDSMEDEDEIIESDEQVLANA